jgi:hypothetical protein
MLVAKEVHRGLAHDPDRFDVETRPKLADVLVSSTTAPAAASMGSALRAHLPSPEPEVGTDAVTSIMRLMDELAAALRRLDTEAPMTANQVWSPQLLERCVHSSAHLMKHLHELQGTVYLPIWQ